MIFAYLANQRNKQTLILEQLFLKKFSSKIQVQYNSR